MGRRFFRRRRKKTEWISGFDQRFTNPLEMSNVFDGAGNPLAKTISFLLAGGTDFDDFQSGFKVERIVGDFNIFIGTSVPQEILADAGAEIRLTIQRQRVYQNVALGAAGPLADDPALHSNPFSATDLGDEEIYWTRRFLQPKPATSTALLVPLTAEDVGAITQPFVQYIGYQNVQKLSQGVPFLDLRARHRVHNDNQLYLYVDVTTADGTPFAGGLPVFAHLQGYARILITPL